MSVILLQQGQREIDTRRHAGRGPDIAVADEDRIRHHVDFGDPALEIGDFAPTGRCLPTGKTSCRGKEERSRADGADARRPGGDLLDRVDEGALFQHPCDATPAGHDEGIDGPEIVESTIDGNGRSAIGGNRHTTSGNDAQAVSGRRTGAVRQREDLIRAEEIEWLVSS